MPMTFEILVLLSLFLILLGVLPWWRHSRWWGYGPSVLLALIFVVLLLMTLTGRTPGR
jgi:Protein of unknown function (DUF3309)